MPHITTRTTYLEMREPPAGTLVPPRADIGVRELGGPSVSQYRDLYRSVGADYCWVDRLVMPDEELRRILVDPRVNIFVLETAGVSAGYSELDRRTGNDIELAYFGLFPGAIGQGLGRFLLNWTLHAAWSYEPARVWVHTCDLDHPAALPNYLQAGFQVYEQKLHSQFVPEARAQRSSPDGR